VPEENFWTLWCKGRLTEADTPTIRMGTTPSGLSRAHLHHPSFFTGWMPFLPPNQQCQSTEGNIINLRHMLLIVCYSPEQIGCLFLKCCSFCVFVFLFLALTLYMTLFEFRLNDVHCVHSGRNYTCPRPNRQISVPSLPIPIQFHFCPHHPDRTPFLLSCPCKNLFLSPLV